MIADSIDQCLKTENQVAKKPIWEFIIYITIFQINFSGRPKKKNLVGSLMKVSASYKAMKESWNGEGGTDYILLHKLV